MSIMTHLDWTLIVFIYTLFFWRHLSEDKYHYHCYYYYYHY